VKSKKFFSIILNGKNFHFSRLYPRKTLYTRLISNVNIIGIYGIFLEAISREKTI